MSCENNPRFPLTETLLGMYLEWNADRSSTQYNISMLDEFPRSIDADRLSRAVESLFEDEEVYRMRLVESAGVPEAYISHEPIKVVRRELSDAEADRYRDNFARPFDLFNEPLARAEIIETPTSVRLALDISHLVIDGTSTALLYAGIAARYENRELPPRSKISFVDYALAEQRSFESAEYAGAKKYAAERFAGRAMSVPPSACTRREEASFLREDIELDHEAIAAYCARHELSANLFAMGVFARTLATFTNEREVVFWTVNHGRRGSELKTPHGCFIRTVPVLGELKGEASPLEYFRSFRLHKAGVYPFSHFCRDLGFSNGFGFVYQSATTDFHLTLDGIPASVYLPMTSGSNELPAMQIYDGKDEFRAVLTCTPGRYDRAFMREFLRRFAVIAANFAADSAARLDEVAVTTPEELSRVVGESYGGDLDYDRSLTFLDLFSAAVKANSAAPAVVAGGVTLSYSELDARSNALAAELVRRGVAEKGFVGIKLPRSVDFVVAALAVEKCGCGYIPIDAAYPPDRVEYMLSDSGAHLVIDESFAFPAPDASVPPPSLAVTPDHPAYMIYTSGSTGRPKGVVLPHRALAALLGWWRARFALAAGQRFLSITSFSFDASVPDLFAPLASGAALHVLSEDERKDLQFVGDYCCRERITGLTTSTQLGLALINSYPELPLEFMMLGGEKLVPFDRTRVKVINGYGPTEFAVCSSYHTVDQSRDYDYPIGRAVPNTWSFVIDRLGQPLPHGYLGEIALAGPQLADGYWKQPEKTANAFVPISDAIRSSVSALSGYTRMYRTGDLARYNDDGELEYCGRIDFQVKLRGFRIEIGEIEHAASTYAGVNAVIAMVRKVGADDHLVLYYTKTGPAIAEADLRQHLERTLAHYMVPDFLVELAEMPLTPGGKIDRRALPLPTSDGREEPLSSLELMKRLARQRKEAKAAAAAKSAAVAEARQYAQLSSNQRGIYTDWLLNPGSTQYNIPLAIRFAETDPERLAAAVSKVLAAHPAFAVRFVEREGDVVQEYDPSRLAAAVPVTTLAERPDDAFFSARMQPFAPKDEPLYRAEVFRYERDAYLLLDVHHTIFDGTSVGIFFTDLMAVMNGGEAQREAKSALEAVRDEQAYFASEESAADLEWFGAYIGELESYRLETSSSGANGAPGEAGRVEAKVGSAAVLARCRELGVTVSDYFLTVFTELLRRVGRSDDVLINFVSSGRGEAELERTSGMFVKTLPLKGVKGAKSFAEAMHTMHDSVIELLVRERVSYATLSERFGVRPEVIFAYEGGIFELPRGTELMKPQSTTVKAPLAVMLTPGNESISLELEYDRSLYSDADMAMLARMFGALAENCAAEPADAPIAAVATVSAAEAERILAVACGEKLEYDEEKTFLNLLHANVLVRPNSTALVDCEGSLTYRELEDRSDALASILRSRGVVSGGFVGVKLPRRKEFMVAAIAVQKCGCGYIPIDPDYPQDRIDYIVADSGARVVIDSVDEVAAALPVAAPSAPKVTPDDPAYMIYTSGSTGKPKGVVVPHRALRNMVAWAPAMYDVHPGDKMATHASFSFDASVIDLFPALAAGCELHILDEVLRKDLQGMRDYIVRNSICGLTMSTQIGSALIDTYPDVPLKYLQMGGEKLMTLAKTNVRLLNGYGPTEFCVSSSYHTVDQERDTDIPIGRAVPNTASLIVDRSGNLLPLGFPGEIALAGPQLSDGYWNNEEKTRAVFVAIPETIAHSPAFTVRSERMYRTGDLARYNAEGELMYLGRLDFQVKLRGFRIEMGEVESVAKTFPGVAAVAAEIREVAGTKHLVLYYETTHEGSAAVSGDALKAHLAGQLTEYMVPDYFVEVESMPMTPNGKINRKLLKSPEGEAEVREYVEPANDTERTIANAYAQILKLERMGATDDFFTVGGTSLIAIKAVVALQKAGLEVQYGDIFKYKTPRQLSAFLRHEEVSESAAVTDPAAVYSSFDYAAIDAMLSKSRSDLFEGFHRHSLGDVLLTGAAGYLGVHILRHLLTKTDSTVYALVRGKGKVTGERRLNSQYVYYFGERLTRDYRDRLVVIEGDITDEALAEQLAAAGVHPTTVINCAAMVKHYVADDRMDAVNVRGVERLVELCERTGARLIQTSTYSVGGMIPASSPAALDETHLYVGQSSDNDYVRTKFLAERAVLAAVAAGRIRGKVMRLGNLMGREADGEFQMNVAANAFVNSLKSYKALGVYPLMALVSKIEMSPIDRVAEAICLLSTTPDEMTVFHPFNCYALDMGAVIAAMNRRGFAIDAVSNSDFAAHVDALKADPSKAQQLQGVLHYAQRFGGESRLTPVVNDWTTTVLYRLGFRWSPADAQYLASFLEMLDGLAVFG